MGQKSRAKKLKNRGGRAEKSAHRRWSSRWFRMSSHARRAGLLIIGALSVLGFGNWYLRSTVPVSVSALLASAGNAEFTYATRQHETYSPACGCIADKSERWRGITFAARRLNVSNITQSYRTAFWIMSTFPQPLEWSPTLFRIGVRVMRFSSVAGRGITLNDIVHPDLMSGAKLINDQTLSPQDAVALLTDKPITVVLTSPYPVAAYVPVENSRITITQSESTFLNDKPEPVITEDYPASAERVTYRDNMVVGGESLSYPMLDIVGPQVVIITDDPAAGLAVDQNIDMLNTSDALSGRRVTALIVSSPFSTRISAMPFGNSTDQTTFAEMPSKPTRSNFAAPDRPAHEPGPDEELVLVGNSPVSIPTHVEPRRRGVMKVAVVESLPISEYSQLQDLLRRSDIVEAHDIRSRETGFDHSGMNFRYPPIPPANGFNVFGLLDRLALRVKQGKMMIGASALSIETPSVVEFDDILAFAPKRNIIPIPLVIDGYEQAFEFSLETTSKVAINGASIRTGVDTSRLLIEYAVVIAAIVQGIGAVVALWQSSRQRQTRSDG